MRKNIGELQKVMKQENICKLKSKSKTIFPQKIEDSSLDFTANVEISLTQSDFSLPNSLKDSKQFNSPEKKEESPKQKQFFQKSFETRKISDTIKIDMKSFENSTCNFTFSISKNKILIINEFNRKMLRLYQIWPSNNRFFLKGRLICGPKTDNCHFLFVLFLIVGVSLVFFILVIPYLWEFVSPILPCFITYLFLSTLIFLFFTTFTDPGIIPRKKVFELFGGIPPAFNETHHNEQIIDKNKRNKKEKKINKRRQKKKYCSTCEIFRPSRASHCNDCGNCVEVFDHHCPFVNNCIGKRNYKYFLGFLISLVLLGVSEIAGFLIRLITIFGQGADNVNQSTVINNSTLVLVVICVIAIPTGLLIICVSILCCFHLHLVIKGKTTKESRKNIKIEDDDRKQTVNWCKSDPPLFNFRQILNEDQIEFLKKKSHSPAGNSHH